MTTTISDTDHSQSSSVIVNISCYKFVELDHLPERKTALRRRAVELNLKGTVLLSKEGINLFVAGPQQSIRDFVEFLREDSAFSDLQPKESVNEYQPFNRMLVKIKAEIIAFGVDGIDPRQYTSRRVTARQLKAWLDEGRPVTLLDTRNDFEVDAGTFRNAVAIGVDDFRDFPSAVIKLPEELKRQPIVTFCTGGIRCEKATPYLEREGFQEIYQLDGGILKYFEECGGAHYDGHCFVFDKRVALDANLQVADLAQCFACQAILSPAEQAATEYVEGVSCPRCYQPAAETLQELLSRREAAIRKATTPLPGSIPYDNVRPISVPLHLDGLEVLDFFDAMKTHLSRDDWRQACAEGRVVCQGKVVLPGRALRSGERLLHKTLATREPVVSAEITVLHEDDAIVVVHKPAPLPMHPCGRFNRNSLSYILEQVYRPLALRPAHRLDADTSGVVVFSKTREVASRVQSQFEQGQVEKTYLACVRGTCPAPSFECHLPISAAPGAGGVRAPDPQGPPASTRFRLLRDNGDGTSLVEAFPLTGRTNQIRAHLWALGLPIVGDPVYLPDGTLGPAQSLAPSDPPLCLHALAIVFTHPMTNKRVRYEAPAPAWSQLAE